MVYIKHEIIACARCGSAIECRANASAKCMCGTIVLSVEEMQYMSERYDACLCTTCLRTLKDEYAQEQIL